MRDCEIKFFFKIHAYKGVYYLHVAEYNNQVTDEPNETSFIFHKIFYK
ncbi:hypothetical protein wTpre_1195 [Wolbachia endosymbiont of Trichogramma pretiosum]|nr:hypothetical protein wTpre_1195 [Wolbachia endosymbiont of Trichogramma pretiosum]